MDAGPDAHLRGTFLEELGIELFQPRLNFPGGLKGRRRFGGGVLADGHPEHGEHAVAGELVHHAAASGHGGHTDRHATVEPVHQLPRAEAFRHRGE